MSRRQFFAEHGDTWKGVALRALVDRHTRPSTYRVFKMNLMVNAKTMLVKSTLMGCRT